MITCLDCRGQRSRSQQTVASLMNCRSLRLRCFCYSWQFGIGYGFVRAAVHKKLLPRSSATWQVVKEFSRKIASLAVLLLRIGLSLLLRTLQQRHQCFSVGRTTPKIAPFSGGVSIPSYTLFVAPTRVWAHSPKTAYRSVQPFLQVSFVCLRDRHRQTDHTMCDIYRNRPHFAVHAIRSKHWITLILVCSVRQQTGLTVQVIDHLNKTQRARVVVCFCEGNTIYGLVRAATRRNLDGHFMFIGR